MIMEKNAIGLKVCLRKSDRKRRRKNESKYYEVIWPQEDSARIGTQKSCTSSQAEG